MMPRLLAVAGPLAGSHYVLTDDEVRIGRDLANSLPIGDLSLSRRHCILVANTVVTRFAILKAAPEHS